MLLAHSRAFMEALARAIEERIKTDQDIYVIKPEELFRVWADVDDDERYKKVSAFAQKHGCRLHTYHRGVGAFVIKA
jgi:intergrase/recombinase